MERKERRHHPREFKLEAVRLAAVGDKTKAKVPRYALRPPCRVTSRLTVEGERPKPAAMRRIDRPRSDPARNLFALIQHQRRRAAPAGYRRDASIKRQDMVDRALGPLQRTGDIARALAALPPLPKFRLLLPR
jgi:hypothetical protein